MNDDVCRLGRWLQAWRKVMGWLKKSPTFLLVTMTTAVMVTCDCAYLLIKCFVMFKEWLESFENFNFTWHASWRCSLTLDNRHPQRSLMSCNQTLEVLQQQLNTHTNSHVMSWQVLWLKSIMKSCLKLTRSEHGLFNGHGSTVSTRNWANAQNMRFSGLCWRGWVTLRLTIRLKGYIYRQHLHTVT